MSVDIERSRSDGLNDKQRSIYDDLSLVSDMEDLELMEDTAEHQNKRRKTFKAPAVVQRLPEPPCPTLFLKTLKSVEESKKSSPLFKRKLEQQSGKEPKKQNSTEEPEEFRLTAFNCQYVTDRIAEHVINCIENQTSPTNPTIPSETLRQWISEGVNLTMNPLISDIQSHLEEQTARLEQYYNRKWEECAPNPSHMSYIS